LPEIDEGLQYLELRACRGLPEIDEGLQYSIDCPDRTTDFATFLPVTLRKHVFTAANQTVEHTLYK
jgi:hypothetical protein